MNNSDKQEAEAWPSIEQAALLIESLKSAESTAVSSTGCRALTDEDRRSYKAGSASPDRAVHIASHLAVCDSCRQAVSALVLQAVSTAAPGTRTTTLAGSQVAHILSDLQGQRSTEPAEELEIEADSPGVAAEAEYGR